MKNLLLKVCLLSITVLLAICGPVKAQDTVSTAGVSFTAATPAPVKPVSKKEIHTTHQKQSQKIGRAHV